MTSNAAFSLDFPHAYGAPPASGVIRQIPDDFYVEELLGFEPSGQGEHLYLLIEKRGHNTQWLAGQLAKLCGIRLHDVGYAGLKDRHACTRQWFSLWLPGKGLSGNSEPDLAAVEQSGITILRAERHDRKLKRGAHLGNRFRLRIRGVTPGSELEQRLTQIARQGVPNYYGEQRFGHQGGNLTAADALLRGERKIKDRNRRGLYLSAARSYLFNRVVAERVRQGNWNQAVSGDRLMMAGTTNLLSVSDSLARAKETDQGLLHPTAPLWGRGRALVEEQALSLETDILAPFAGWLESLERMGLTRERRATRLLAGGMRWQWPQGDQLELSFVLPPGTFATSVLRECCDYQVAAPQESEINDETAAIE